jgi:hypothetical protein
VATKADFNAEEWSKVMEGPLLAGLRVVAADRGGTIRESIAIGKVYAHARQAHGDSGLLDELVATPPAVDTQRLQGVGDIATATRETLSEAARLVGEKGSPEDLDAYRRFVLSVAQAAAEAHKEGGFVGIGGKPVSEQEQAALDEIAAVLEGEQGAGGPGPESV